MEICRLSGGESLVCERENLYSIRTLTFSQWKDLTVGVMREIGSFNNCTSESVLDVLKPG